MALLRISLCMLLGIGFGFRPPPIHPAVARISSSSILYLNRIFFEEHESSVDPRNRTLTRLHASDDRSVHITTILKSAVGDRLKVGILDRGITDSAELIQSNDEGLTFDLGSSQDIKSCCRPNVDLILAVPRPLRLERLLPVIASQGVGKVVLVGADKVEKDYFGSHLFRRPEALRACLVEGLSQAGVDCNVPQIIVRKSLSKFLHNDIESLFPANDYARIVCHPQMGDHGRRISQISFAGLKKVVVAVGPEGGWTDEEVERFEALGFSNVHLGNRILRTDTAVR